MDGRHEAPWTTEAIHNRVDNKLVICYRQDYGGDIQVNPQFSYELLNGQITLSKRAQSSSHLWLPVIVSDVPDGVEELEDFAFLSCRHYLELSIPRSVSIIGDNIFGNGGKIEIRDE